MRPRQPELRQHLDMLVAQRHRFSEPFQSGPVETKKSEVRGAIGDGEEMGK